MPRKAINYSKSVIYKLCCNDPSITDEYVGSTTDKTRRKQEHKCGCNNPNFKKYNYYVYQFIREHGGFDNWSMVVIEEHHCDNKNQLEIRERYYIETLQSTLNKNIPTRTLKEYVEQNKEKISEYQKQYYEQNKEEISEYKKQYYEQNKEEISEYNKQYKEEHEEEISEYKKQYYEQNKEELLKYQQQYREQNKEEKSEYNKQYYEQNKEKIKEMNNQKINCECGGKYTNCNKSRHMKSKKHTDYLNTLLVKV
jgi:DNA repair exonuclease SbcCD ATPase subunit